ncbi:MAG: hypothetical protein ABIG28_02980 [archaeon]
MQVKEKTKSEIEMRLGGMGDYVKMGYLQGCLRNNLDFDTRKFVLIRLSGLYEVRKMFLDAGKMMRAGAEINTTLQGKINDFVKSMELFVKGGSYDEAEVSSRRALSFANETQKMEIKKSLLEFYKTQARLMEQRNKRQGALKIYEKLFDMSEDGVERDKIKEKLLELYEGLGRMRDFFGLKKSH